jgi:F0F1-type ATP synthase alpha subunit
MPTLTQRELGFTAQREQITRVSGAIASHVRHYLAVHAGEQFHSSDLDAYVRQQVGHIAPGSADRILRLLKRNGEVSYTVVNRRASLYLSEGST